MYLTRGCPCSHKVKEIQWQRHISRHISIPLFKKLIKVEIEHAHTNTAFGYSKYAWDEVNFWHKAGHDGVKSLATYIIVAIIFYYWFCSRIPCWNSNEELVLPLLMEMVIMAVNRHIVAGRESERFQIPHPACLVWLSKGCLHFVLQYLPSYFSTNENVLPAHL